jgi:hypothetical protein
MHMYVCVVDFVVGMDKIVHVHHVDKDAFLKRNHKRIEPIPMSQLPTTIRKESPRK